MRALDDDWYDPPTPGELQKLWNRLGVLGDVDLAESHCAGDERRARRVAMRTPVLHIERHVHGHFALVARRSARGQRP